MPPGELFHPLFSVSALGTGDTGTQGCAPGTPRAHLLLPSQLRVGSPVVVCYIVAAPGTEGQKAEWEWRGWVCTVGVSLGHSHCGRRSRTASHLGPAPLPPGTGHAACESHGTRGEDVLYRVVGRLLTRACTARGPTERLLVLGQVSCAPHSPAPGGSRRVTLGSPKPFTPICGGRMCGERGTVLGMEEELH